MGRLLLAVFFCIEIGAHTSVRYILWGSGSPFIHIDLWQSSSVEMQEELHRFVRTPEAPHFDAVNVRLTFLVRAMERGGDKNDASPLLQAGLILESLGKFEEAAVRFMYITLSADVFAVAGNGVALAHLAEGNHRSTNQLCGIEPAYCRLAAPGHFNNDRWSTVIAVYDAIYFCSNFGPGTWSS